MYRLLVLTLLILCIGCAREPNLPQSASEATGESASTGGVKVESTVLDVVPEMKYPEKPEVVRLLVHATHLESNGKFVDALAVANEALAIDPNSPKASELKTRLEELLRRV